MDRRPSGPSWKPTPRSRAPHGERRQGVHRDRDADLEQEHGGREHRTLKRSAPQELAGVPTATLTAEQGDDNRPGGANANQGLSFSVLGGPTFKTNVAESLLLFTFADPYGQRPGVCFTPCPRNAKCLGTSRCTRALHDGLTSGSGWFRIGFTSQPAEPADFTYSVTPVAARNGTGDIVSLLGSDGGVVAGLSETVPINLPGPGKTNGGGGGSGGSGGGATGGGSGGSGGGEAGACSVTRTDCCPTGASLCGVPQTTCAGCPAGTTPGIVCAVGAPCNTMGGISVGSLICHC